MFAKLDFAHEASHASDLFVGGRYVARLVLIYGFIGILACALTSLPARSSSEGARQFVDTSAKQGIQILSNRAASDADRRAQFATVVLAAFDSDGIGRLVVGPAWATATPEQQARFQAVFKRALVNIYLERFFDYDGESLRTFGAAPTANDAMIVTSTVSTPSGSGKHNLEWLVVRRAGQQKILDVTIDGVSTTATTASDYQSVLRATGGNFDRLIGLLDAKNK
jgi:phospholipid transport system substrate-binding protein